MRAQEGSTVEVSAGPDPALALELVRVTEAAAVAAGRGAGRDRRHRGAAAVALHGRLASLPVRGTVVIGDDRDGAPVPGPGDPAGAGAGPPCDLGIGMGDGARSTAGDVPGSLVTVVVAGRGALYVPPPSAVVEKLAVGPDCAGVVDITRPVAENLHAVAAAKRVRVSDVEVGVLDRPWHRDLVAAIRDAGARVRALRGGDLAGAVAVARPGSPVDVLLGTGGAAEGVLAAAALACTGGAMQVRVRSGGRDEVLHTDDLVRGGDVLFCATGIATSELLHGVRYRPGRATTRSVVACSTSGTVRTVEAEHRLARHVLQEE